MLSFGAVFSPECAYAAINRSVSACRDVSHGNVFVSWIFFQLFPFEIVLEAEFLMLSYNVV